MQTEQSNERRALGVLIDARCVRSGASGVGHYVAGLLRGIDLELKTSSRKLLVTALRLETESATFADLWSGLSHVRILDVGADYEDHPSGDVFLNLGIAEVMRSTRSAVLISPFFIAPVGPRSFARVVGVLDDLPWSEPDNYPATFRAFIKAQATLTLPFAERAFTLSRATARALKKQLRPLIRTRLDRVPGAVDSTLFRPATREERASIRGELNVTSSLPLAVYVASHEKRKNHAMLARALRPLAGRVQLALVGRSTEAQRRSLRAIAGDLRIAFAQPRCHAEVAAWTRTADVVLFPSLNEGFGLPPLEAIACGVPLIASDIAVIREVIGRSARLVPPDEPGAWTAAVSHLLENAPTEGFLAKGVAHAHTFTWQASARELLRLGEEAANQRRGGTSRFRES